MHPRALQGTGQTWLTHTPPGAALLASRHATSTHTAAHKQGPPSSQHHLARSCLLPGPCPELLTRMWGQDVVRRYKETHSSFDGFESKVVFQLNDTHPTLAVPELMRLLMDEQGLGWTRAWDLCSKVPARIALQP